MGFSDFRPGGVPSPITFTDTQAELLNLLERFVELSTAETESVISALALPEFRTVIRRLCEGAPKAAQVVVTTIHDMSSDGLPRQQRPLQGVRSCQSAEGRRASKGRPSRTSKAKARTTRFPGKVVQISSMGSAGKLSSDIKSTEGASVRQEDDSTAARREACRRRTANGGNTAQTKRRRNRGSQAVTNQADSVTEKVPSASATADTVPATATKETGRDVASDPPQTEDVQRERIPTSPQNVALSLSSKAGAPWQAETSPKDLALHAVRIIHNLSKYPRPSPKISHSGILQTLQNNHKTTDVPSANDEWSDGATWMQILKTGASAQEKATLFNMLEYMGAWNWYDAQIRLEQAPVQNQHKQPISHKAAASRVLDRMQGRHMNPVGNPIIEQIRQEERKRITVWLSRGQKLSRKLVKPLGLGILFNPSIWDYLKMKDDEIDNLVKSITSDPRQVKLLQVLESPLKDLVNNGRPDLHALYDALKKEELIPEQEFCEVREAFALDSEPMPEGTVSTAVDQLLQQAEGTGAKKRKFDDSVGLVLSDGVKLTYSSLTRLRHEEWLDQYVIMAAMQISDKPSFVRYDRSIPLDEVGRSGQTKPIRTPLAGWAAEIAHHRRTAESESGEEVALVYFAPLNHRNDHFTLLEINEREQVIRHYDSWAEKEVLAGTKKQTRVEKLVQEQFGHLGYTYSETATPQQGDHWSCGIRVIWNFRRAANSLPIGGWNDVLNSERMKMEIVEALLAYFTSQTVRRKKIPRTLTDAKRRARMGLRSSRHRVDGT